LERLGVLPKYQALHAGLQQSEPVRVHDDVAGAASFIAIRDVCKSPRSPPGGCLGNPP
jgi:hypothetical protein